MTSNYSPMPDDLYVAEQVRELDRRAIEDFGIPGIVLMKRAGRSAFECIKRNWPGVDRLSIWCGAGNNGGDGYIIAGLAQQQGYDIQLVQVGPENKLKGDALLACEWARDQGVPFTQFGKSTRPEGQLIVDALLGTGLQGGVRGDFATAIERINTAQIPIFAVDIASGLCSDQGIELGSAVKASATISFIGLKRGLFTGAGPECTGKLEFADLGVPGDVYVGLDAPARRVHFRALRHAFKPKARTAHKGDFGHVLIVGGNSGMGGAALLAARAAGRVGAGLVSLATHPEHVSAVITGCPEIMAHPVSSGQDLEPLVEKATVIVIGPGLGQTAWSEQLLRVVLATDKPLIVDADGLNLIARGVANHAHRDNWVLTPHPGEAARLLGSDTAAVQANRFEAVRGLQARFGGVALLKGAGTLICAASGPLMLCTDGNPGMASGGMGDVLSGLLGGLVAQGKSLSDATSLGVCLHAAAADRAAALGERGMLATDLLQEIRGLVNPELDSTSEQ